MIQNLFRVLKQTLIFLQDPVILTSKHKTSGVLQNDIQNNWKPMQF